MKIYSARTLFLLAVLNACNFFHPPNVFDSDKLLGKYNVDVMPYVNSSLYDKDENNQLASGIIAFGLSTTNIEMTFYKNNTGILDMKGGISVFMNSNTPIEFNYKIEQDSVLYIKYDSNKDKGYVKCGIIRKFSDSYDYIQILIEDGGDAKFFNLRKVA